MANPRPPVAPEPARWTIHGERLVDDTRRLSVAQVELPGGYVDMDENPAVAAAHEIEEETGLSRHSRHDQVNYAP